MEVRVERKKRRTADDPGILAQAAEWIHMGVQMHASVIDPTSTCSPRPTPNTGFNIHLPLHTQEH